MKEREGELQDDDDDDDDDGDEDKRGGSRGISNESDCCRLC